MYDLSWLNPTPHAIAVYASQPLSPVATQHSLPSRSYPLLGPDLHRLDRTSLRLAHPKCHLVRDIPDSTGHGRPVGTPSLASDHHATAGSGGADLSFPAQLIRSPGFHRPIMRVASSGDRRRPFKNAPVKLARPVCKTVPADLRKIPRQCGDIGVVADAVEPFEHERHILAFLASRGDWDFLVVDRAADGVRE